MLQLLVKRLPADVDPVDGDPLRGVFFKDVAGFLFFVYTRINSPRKRKMESGVGIQVEKARDVCEDGVGRTVKSHIRPIIFTKLNLLSRSSRGDDFTAVFLGDLDDHLPN